MGGGCLAAHRRPRARRHRARWCPGGARARSARRRRADGAAPRPALTDLQPGRPGVRVHSASRFTGAWPSGKATGFGPVIPGSNPGAPANVTTVSESRPKLAAVVMAGGRGTRMLSSTPKHLHPILGRRMVDWIVEAARPLGADPLVVVVSPDTADEFEGLTSPCRLSRSGRATRCGAPSRRSPVRTRCSSSRAIRRCSRASCSARCSRPIARRTRPPPSSRSCPPTSAATAASFATADGDLESIVEAADASPEQLAIGEANSSIYVFRARPALAGAPPARSRSMPRESCT